MDLLPSDGSGPLSIFFGVRAEVFHVSTKTCCRNNIVLYMRRLSSVEVSKHASSVNPPDDHYTHCTKIDPANISATPCFRM